MRKQTQFVIGIAVASALASAVEAVPAVYTFDYPTITASAAPGTAVASSATVGTLGQDNFYQIFGAQSYFRNDAKPGFTGNWLSSYNTTPTDAPAADGIISRKNDSNFSYQLTNSGYASFSADVLVGVGNITSATPPVTSYKRSIVGPGVDLNNDGGIRTSATAQNAEAAFQFGYESSTGIGWYIRGAAFGTSYPGSGTNIATGVTGTWTTKLLVDFTANSGDGAGTLLIKQLYDGAGNPVNDTFHLANAALSNVNLGIKAMNAVAQGGTPTASDPTTWNGFMARTANNGGIDNISFESITKTSMFLGGSGSWFATTSWFAGAPNAVDAAGEIAGTGGTIYADANVTLGKLSFTNANSTQITGTGTLTTQVTTGNALFDVQTGAHKLNIPLNVASNTVLNVAAGASLKVSDPVTVQAGKTLISTGSGTVTYESTVTILTGGALQFASSQAVQSLALENNSSATIASSASGSSLVTIGSLSMGAGSHVDVGTNRLLLNASADEVRSALHDGSIYSSKSDERHGLGYVQNGGQVGITYTLNGDANLDQKIDFTDLKLVAANYDNAATTYAAGDFNFDGKKDFNDLFLLAKNYVTSGYDGKILPDGASAAFTADWASALALAPEPASLMVLGLPLAMLTRKRRA